MKTQNTQTCSFTKINFHNAMNTLIQRNIKGYFDYPCITLEKPYFWEVGNIVILKKDNTTIAEFK